VTRKDLQAIAEARMQDAQLLYRHRRFDAAYYLAGYAIECALKACIARKTKRYDFPDKELAQNVYTHDLAQLARLAGLRDQLEEEFRNDPLLETRWDLVRDWKEKSRYELRGRDRAEAMLDAVGDERGIFACLKKYW
jgi:HEPN domain-containing protein